MSENRGSNRRTSASDASSRVARNTFWNLIGTVLPILLAIVAIPVLINSIGTTKFGVFAIAWALLTYFALLDFGVGQSTIKFLSEAFENGETETARSIYWTSIMVAGALGTVSALILAVTTPLLINTAFDFPPELRQDARTGFYLLALGIPLVTLIQTLGGVIQARHKFALYNSVQVPNSIVTQAAPLMVLPFTQSLAWLIGSLVAARLWGTVVFFIFSLREMDEPFKGPFLLRDDPGRFFSYNGWQAVTNVVSPLMVNADRFVIGIVASASAVTYYVTPAEAVNRLTLVAISLSRTVFPIFSAETQMSRRTDVYSKALKHLALLTAPVVAGVIAFAPDILRIWIGPEFAERSSLVMQIMALGLLANSLATINFALVQGIGRADITAKFHIFEFVVYLPMLLLAVSLFGITGAAAVWTFRMVLDLLLLVSYVRFTSRIDQEVAARERIPQILVAAFVFLSASWLLSSLQDVLVLKVALWILLVAGFAAIAWVRFLDGSERSSLKTSAYQFLHRLRPRKT